MRHIGDQHRRRLLSERHLLGTHRRDARPIDVVTDALALLHSTDPVTPYMSLHARTDASISDIEHALYDDRRLLRHTTVRRTVFAMRHDVVPLAHGAVNQPIVAKLRKNLTKWIDASPDTAVPGARFLADVEAAVLDHLVTAGATTGTRLAEAVTDLQIKVDPVPGAAYSKPIRITSKVLEVLAADGRIARGRPTGNDITSAAWTWQLIDDWLDDGIAELDAADALAALLARYLATFAPATVTDMAWWTGLPKGKVKAALDALDATTVSLDDVDEPGLVLPDDDLAVSDPSRADETLALLPGLDSTAMGWKQRSWYVDDGAATGIFDRNGNAGPTIWLGGRVVGVWTQRADGSIATELAEPVSGVAQHSLAAEVERTAAWLGDVRVKWRYPTPITKRLFAP